MERIPPMRFLMCFILIFITFKSFFVSLWGRLVVNLAQYQGVQGIIEDIRSHMVVNRGVQSVISFTYN